MTKPKIIITDREFKIYMMGYGDCKAGRRIKKPMDIAEIFDMKEDTKKFVQNPGAMAFPETFNPNARDIAYLTKEKASE